MTFSYLKQQCTITKTFQATRTQNYFQNIKMYDSQFEKKY